MNLCDSHCHLYDVENLEEEIKLCKEIGISHILCVSEDLKTMEKTLNLRDLFGEIVYPALGIHPVFISLNEEEEIKKAFDFLKKHIKEVFAIGEIGLDFKYAKDDKEKEKQYFWLKEQIEIAKEENKPINLHSRRALREVLEIGMDYYKKTNIPVLLHWFTHSKKLIKKAVEENLYISAGPSVLYNQETLNVAKEIPLKNLLLESDAPVPFSNSRARPSWILEVAKKLSEGTKIDISKLSEDIFKNFNNYLRI
jgi:TatD DNase family protein